MTYVILLHSSLLRLKINTDESLNLNLTGTLLQSIMTVTQRRGVLVKKECID